jgi:RNA polymerase sigma-70 factor, ECF subfamily
MKTPASLLERLRSPDSDAWTRFVKLYTPLLYHWALRAGFQASDATDLVQEVFALLLRKMPEFAYDDSKSFRAWLRAVMHNKGLHLRRRTARAPLPLEGPALDDQAAEKGDGLSDIEYRQHLVSQALRLMQAEFAPTTWKACWETVVGGRPAAEVATELGMSPSAVYVAKFRVLKRLRQELAGMLE